MRQVAIGCFLAVLVAATAGSSEAVVFNTSNPIGSWQHPDGTLHYYQVVVADGFGPGEPFSWADAEAYAEAHPAVPGHQSYLATLTTPAELQMVFDNNNTRHAGWLGAHFEGGIWKWVVGPEAGAPIFFSVSGTGGLCSGNRPKDRIHQFGSSGAAPSIFFGGMDCILPCCGVNFLIESSVPPIVPAPAPSWGRMKTLYR